MPRAVPPDMHRKTPLKISLETIRALEQVTGGGAGLQSDEQLGNWPHTPPLHFRTDRSSCGIKCVQLPPRRRRRH